MIHLDYFSTEKQVTCRKRYSPASICFELHEQIGEKFEGKFEAMILEVVVITLPPSETENLRKKSWSGRRDKCPKSENLTHKLGAIH